MLKSSKQFAAILVFPKSIEIRSELIKGKERKSEFRIMKISLNKNGKQKSEAIRVRKKKYYS